MSLIFAIESSCDETAMAVLKDDKELLANVVSSQIDSHQLYGGVVPEIASRLHIQNISMVLEQTIKKANINLKDIDAFAVTKGPGLIGSLHVGLQVAKTLSLAYQKPLIGVHHIAGHIYANQLVDEIVYPCLVLVVSGGHTELVYMKAPLEFEVIGQTYDDAVGEAFDKVGRVVGLPYPGGVAIDKLSKDGKVTYSLPKPLDDNSYNFSFSGLKSAVINLVHNTKQRQEIINIPDLAASFQHVVVDLLVSKSIRAAKDYGVKQILLAGGVAANSGLRATLTKAVKEELPDIKLSLPPLWCCTDNAAMIAVAAKVMYDQQMFDSLDLSAKPSVDL
jgi:putative glycoprotease GCP